MKLNFISIQATYSHAQIALFKNSDLCEVITQQDSKASSHLIPYSQKLLENSNLTLQDIDFIAIDKGPGAFTSLRVAIATINGIAFNNKIPLVGVNSLEALRYQTIQYLNKNKIVTGPVCVIVLLNAYNNDVYYLINQETGCKKIDLVLDQVAQVCSEQPIIFVGNGSLLHKEAINTLFAGRLVSLDHEFATPSAETIGVLALEIFKKQEKHEFSIEPYYIKEQVFAIRAK